MATALAVAFGLLLASPAFAATASVTTTPQIEFRYAAAPGERNQVTASYVHSTGCFSCEVVVHDAGAAVLAGPGCAPIDEQTARCTPADIPPPGSFRPTLPMSIAVGDGADTVIVPDYADPAIPNVRVSGGDGDDRLSGAGVLAGDAGNDVLTGGSNDGGTKGGDQSPDWLDGGPGDDVLRAGVGNDALSGGPGNDVLDGGPDTDRASYTDHTAAVRVDLADPRNLAGERGERDRLTGVEAVVGGSGDDVLLGGEQADSLDGGAGDDRLVGRGGSDRLEGGAGADVLDGRAGNDDVWGGDGRDVLRGGDGNDDILAKGGRDGYEAGASGDVIDGGAGDDRIYAGKPRALHCGSGDDLVGLPTGALLSGCETVRVGTRFESAGTDTAIVTARPRLRRDGGLRFRWECDASSARCEIRVAVRLPGSTTLGSRRAVLRERGESRSIVVRPRRSLRRGQVVQVSISGAIVGKSKPAFTARWRIRL